MEKTRINYQETRDLGEQLKKEAAAYQEIYTSQIYTNFKNSIEACFQGDDATTAINQLDALRDDFDAMTNVITQYGNQLIKAAQGYEDDMRASKVAASALTANRK